METEGGRAGGELGKLRISHQESAISHLFPVRLREEEFEIMGWLVADG